MHVDQNYSLDPLCFGYIQKTVNSCFVQLYVHVEGRVLCIIESQRIFGLLFALGFLL